MTHPDTVVAFLAQATSSASLQGSSEGPLTSRTGFVFVDFAKLQSGDWVAVFYKPGATKRLRASHEGGGIEQIEDKQYRYNRVSLTDAVANSARSGSPDRLLESVLARWPD